MLTIRVILDVKEEHHEELERFLSAEQKKMEGIFPGCHRFHLFGDLSDEGRYLLYEEWEDAASFKAYKDSDSFRQNGQVLFPMLSNKPDSLYVEGEPITV